jgi:hypothetical protein
MHKMPISSDFKKQAKRAQKSCTVVLKIFEFWCEWRHPNGCGHALSRLDFYLDPLTLQPEASFPALKKNK